MTAERMAARVQDLAAELTAWAKRDRAPGLTLADAVAELRSAKCSGSIGLDVPTSEFPPEWTVWDGTSFHRSGTLEGAMAAWRASRGRDPLAEAERVVAPLADDDAVVPLFEPMSPTPSVTATTVQG